MATVPSAGPAQRVASTEAERVVERASHEVKPMHKHARRRRGWHGLAHDHQCALLAARCGNAATANAIKASNAALAA